MSQLQQQFEREMEIHWCNSQGEPDIDYVNWLEAKVEKLTASNTQITPPDERDCDTCVHDGECMVTVLKCKGYLRAA
jgi:hypothetical protein